MYQESLQDELLTDINNNVLGDKYSLIGEAVYEKQFSKGNSLSFGLRHTQSLPIMNTVTVIIMKRI